MLAEVFMLRLEAALRGPNAPSRPATTTSDTRFVPMKPSNPVKELAERPPSTPPSRIRTPALPRDYETDLG
jgi:hypothetical protein